MAQSPYFQAAVTAARRVGLDPSIFTRQINQESGFNPGANSPAGAQGIAQIVPKYHPDAPPASDPVGQLNWAAQYMKGLVDKYGGYAPALSVYNSGQPNSYKSPSFAGGQTYNYVRNILGATQGSVPNLSQPPGLANLTQPTISSPLTNPVVQQVVASNDKLLGITPPPFPQAQALAAPATAKRMTTGSTGQLTYQIQGHATRRTQAAISLAEDYLGTPYVWGGDNPNKGFDCSGLLQYVWSRAGVSIPRTTYDQFRAGTPVSKSSLQPGDAVFFTGSDPQNGLPGHVGMYLGGGKIIEAPHTGADVQISNLSDHKDFVGARRYA